MKTVFTWLKRLALGVIGTIILLLLLVTGIILSDTAFGANASDVTNITFTDGSGNVQRGYLAQPDGPGPHPTVLLIHEWWGLNHGMTVLANALADEGYLVYAPDVYQNKVTDSFVRAIWLRVVAIPVEEVQTDLDIALDYLLALEGVDTDRVASMGFCFGGGQSLQLGLRQSEKLSATIIYYGQVVTGLNELMPLAEAAPVLGVFAEEDQQILPEDVLEFEANLNSLDIENEITIYEGVGHGFVNEDNYNQPGPARDAWQQAVIFLEKNLKDGS
ncbi:MAG: dienelactone hydrolase family protein [Chloroflexota bacterium]